MKLCDPAAFRAVHVYSPVLAADKASICKTEERGPKRPIDTPAIAASKNWPPGPWKVQVISNGKSPSLTMQLVWTWVSGVKLSSSPKLNAVIFGRTTKTQAHIFIHCLNHSYSRSATAKGDKTPCSRWHHGRIDGSMVECMPPTHMTRVRFPVDATAFFLRISHVARRGTLLGGFGRYLIVSRFYGLP